MSSSSKPTSSEISGVSRRQFIQTAALAGAGLGVLPRAWAADPKADMPYRTLGKTGEKISALGLGGYHLGIPGEAEALRIIRGAIDKGINFMDNCWDYHDGLSETRMGQALRDGYRDKVFLMSKIDGQTRTAAAKQIDESLRRLQTDRVDLMQFHEIIRADDPGRIFGSGGIEAMLEAKKAGKVRYIGFTGHKDPEMHLRMLLLAASHKFHFDAVQMPLNVMDAHFRSFEKKVLPILVEQGIGVLGMKPMGSGLILRSNTVKPIECLHYALNLPTSTVITGIDRYALLDQALEAARTFKPMSKEAVDALLARTAQAAATGNYERFKTSTDFDGTAHNPQWLG